MNASDLEEGHTISACPTQPDLIGWTLSSGAEVERLEADESGPVLTEFIPRRYHLLILERRIPIPTGTIGITVSTHTETRTAWVRGEDDVEVA